MAVFEKESKLTNSKKIPALTGESSNIIENMKKLAGINMVV